VYRDAVREPGRITIIGAGPSGLACGRELDRLGYSDWVIYERGVTAGGNAASVLDPAGFTWDLGGHVVFSHFGEFDRLLAEVMDGDISEHERSSYVVHGDRWVPYPFQNNLRYLPPEVAYQCLLGLIDAPGGSETTDFGTWMERTFGSGITAHFMRPYNLKVWATPAQEMSATWIAERVSVVDYRRALRSVVLQRDDVSWGPNNTFAFPAAGGTGEIYRRIARGLGDHVAYGREVVGVDSGRGRLWLASGEAVEYDVLVSTMPLDLLVAAISDCPTEVRAAAQALEHTSVSVVGVGVEQPLKGDWSWLYFPEDSVPFYRVTNFAHYAAANVPGGDTGRLSAFLTETSFSTHRPRPGEDLGARVVDSLAQVGLIVGEAPVVSLHRVDVDYAYPIPTLSRDRALAVIQPWLRARGIYSRGRFGSWRYELGNMDHAVKMGIDVARLLLEGRPEELRT
jgi:protoporphyrinogen oxidase